MTLDELLKLILHPELQEVEMLKKLVSWEQVWDSLNDMGAGLGDANKPLAVTASWALLKRENERLREALTTIAHQKKIHELTDEDYERGCSFEEGYDDIITIARAALEGK